VASGPSLRREPSLLRRGRRRRAGAVGAACAYFAAYAGHQVTVVDRGAIASGASSACEGNILVSDKSPGPELDLALHSQEVWLKDLAEHGELWEFEPKGGLVVASTERGVAGLRELVAHQRALGMTVEDADATDLRDLEPHLSPVITAGAYYAQDAQVQPMLLVAHLLRLARERGARVLTATEVIGFLREGDRVVGVRTSAGDLAAGAVVNAAGPWASQIGKMVGVELPVRPLKRHIWITERFDAIPGPTPQTIDFHSGFYFRKEGESVIWSGGDAIERWDFNTEVEWDELERSLDKAARRVPVLVNAQLRRGWAGLREVTPDHLPIIGPVPGLEGFVCATGFSGHGFMHAPASGRLVAELLLDGRAFLDLTPFHFDRFAEAGAAEHKELSIGGRVEDE
jgi:glycine/D-amino acid oxidase-like deaminating enzyme